MQYPQIRIRDGWLIRENVSRHLHELWGKDSTLIDSEGMDKVVEQYIAAWKPYEDKIVKGMCRLLDLEFRQNFIDVYIAPWFAALSDPLIIGIKGSPDEFIDTLTHELLHRLLTDNTKVSYDAPLINVWEQLFGSKHTFGALVHIPVHAVHKAIYLDALKEPARLKREVDRLRSMSKNTSDYIEAWEYVEENDYNDLIKKLKSSYEDLAKSTTNQ